MTISWKEKKLEIFFSNLKCDQYINERRYRLSFINRLAINIMNKLLMRALFFSAIIGCIGAFSTYYLSILVGNELKTQSHLKLKNIAKQVSIRFQDAINISVNDLQALQAFYSSNQERLSQDSFDHYMKVLTIEDRDYIQALSWVPLIKNEERDSFEAAIKSQLPNFNITERDEEDKLIVSKNKPYYTPVTFISPYGINKAAQGFDLSSNSTRSVSLKKAKNTGEITATSKIRLVQESESSYGFLIIAPVYRTNVSLVTEKERSDSLIGYVTGVFRINNLMENARKQADKEGLILTLLDVEKENGGLLYGNKGEKAVFTFDLTIPDRRWKLEVSLNKNLLSNIESPAIVYWMLISGIIISVLLALCVYGLQIVTFRSQHIKQLSKQLQEQNNQLEVTVAERTNLLEQKNALLNKHVKELTEQRKTLSSLMIESKIAKNSAEERAKDLARSNKDLDDFAYIASHDLKAPLRGIDQLANWVAEDIAEGNFDEVPENIRLMRTRVQRLESLLNDLLAYSRANRQEYKLTQINCNQLVEDLFALISPPKGFQLHIKGPLPNFSTVNVPFEQVLRNLLNNAVKHHDKPNGNIIVSYEDEARYYKFFIEDDGPGISHNNHMDIFIMFKTLKPRDEVEGSGMGLAIIKKIVEFYGGKVSVESEIAKGSIFSFTWPKDIEKCKSDLVLSESMNEF